MLTSSAYPITVQLSLPTLPRPPGRVPTMLCASPAAALGALYVTHLVLSLPS